MRDSLKKWRTTEITQALVDERICEWYQNNLIPESPDIYMSPNLQADLIRKVGSTTGPGVNIMTWHSSFDSHRVLRAPLHLENLLFVGTEQQLKRVEWDEIDEEFEKEFLK